MHAIGLFSQYKLELVMMWFFFCLALVLAVNGEPRAVETEVEELFEMVPYDDVLALGMEYAMTDEQVKSLIQYISGPKFKSNLAALEGSPPFQQLLSEGEKYNIDGFSVLNKVNQALSMPPVTISIHRKVKRSPGRGVVGLVRDAFEITPVSEIKEAYQYKMSENPVFKGFMDKVLTGEGKHLLVPIVSSKPYLETKRDLEDMGIPLKEIQDFIEHQLTDFFELESHKRVIEHATEQ